MKKLRNGGGVTSGEQLLMQGRNPTTNMRRRDRRMAEKRVDEGSSNSRVETVVFDCRNRISRCGYCRSSGYTRISHGFRGSLIGDGSVISYSFCEFFLLPQILQDCGLKALQWMTTKNFLTRVGEELAHFSTNLRWKARAALVIPYVKASDFVPSKEQFLVSKRMQRFLDGTLDVKITDQFKDECNPSKGLRSLASEASSSVMVTETPLKESSVANSEFTHDKEEYKNYLSNKIDSRISVCIKSGEFPSAVQLHKAVVRKVTPQAMKKLTEVAGDLLYTSNIAFLIAAFFLTAITIRRKEYKPIRDEE